jgi:nucleoid-associated protein YgaU
MNSFHISILTGVAFAALLAAGTPALADSAACDTMMSDDAMHDDAMMAEDSMGDDSMMADDSSHDDSMGSDAMGDDSMGSDAMGDDAMGDDAMGDDSMSGDAMGDDSMMADDAMGTMMVDYVVKAGDSLWSIAEAKLCDGNRFHEIVDANPGAIGGDMMLEVGQVLHIPD